MYILVFFIDQSAIYPHIWMVQKTKMKWACAWQNQQNGMCAQPRLRLAWAPPSLIRVFTARMKKPCVLSYPLNAQLRLWCRGSSECSLDAQVIMLVLSCAGSNSIMYLYSFSLTKHLTSISQCIFPFKIFLITAAHEPVCRFEIGFQHKYLGGKRQQLKVKK